MSLLRLLLLLRGSSESSVFASPRPRKAAGKFFFIRQLASMLLLVVQGLLHGRVTDDVAGDDGIDAGDLAPARPGNVTRANFSG